MLAAQDDAEAQGDIGDMITASPATTPTVSESLPKTIPFKVVPKTSLITSVPIPKPPVSPLRTKSDLVNAAESARALSKDHRWGIQVGAFSNRTQAEKAARQAMQLATDLKGSKLAIDGARATGGVHRARLENLSEIQARKACERLISNNSPCFIYRSGSQNL